MASNMRRIMSKALAVKNVAAVLLGVGMILSMFAFATPASANTSTFGIPAATAEATSTVKSMPAGTGTTTLTFDAFNQTFSGGQKQRPDFGLLVIQRTASSSASVLNVAFEFAEETSGFDCDVTPTACDWYRDFTDFGATTTPTVAPVSRSIRLQAASTTIGGATSTTPRETYAFVLPTVARYTRVIFTTTGGSSTVWAKIIPIQQR